MKAWSLSQKGEPADALVLRGVEPITEPCTPSDIVVEVVFAALNPVDLNLMRAVPDWLPCRGHRIAGMDFAGRIVARGPRVPVDGGNGLVVGAEVCGVLPISAVAWGQGTLVEYLSVPYDVVSLRPMTMSLRESAGLGLVGQTALAMSRSRTWSTAGDRVLINGASGGVGSILIQMAAARGAHVLAVCSGANADLVKRLGAKEVVDYTMSDSLPDLVCSLSGGPVDAVFNCVGDSDLYAHSGRFLADDGDFVDITSTGGPIRSLWRTLTTSILPGILRASGTPRYRAVNLAPAGALQREVVGMVNDGTVRQVPIDSVWPMEQVVQAYERLASKRAKGKVLIQVPADG